MRIGRAGWEVRRSKAGQVYLVHVASCAAKETVDSVRRNNCLPHLFTNMSISKSYVPEREVLQSSLFVFPICAHPRPVGFQS